MSIYVRLAVLTALLTLLVPASSAAGPSDVRQVKLGSALAPRQTEVLVDDAGPAQGWKGAASMVGARVRGVPECRRVFCDQSRVTVDLPKSTWKQPGGVQIAIRWARSTGGSLDLVVYRDGERVAVSATSMGTAQSVIIPEAENGTYDVYVTYGVARGRQTADRTISYNGLAEVEYEPSVKPVRDLLPDLVPLPQENVTFDKPPRYFNDFAISGSCFNSERVEDGAEQCLRFDQVLKNAGAGPAEIRFDRVAGRIGNEDVVQRIYRSDGSHSDIPSGQVEFHGVHGHYHFEGFAQSKLWPLDAAGKLVGKSPASVGDKVSFCITDTDLVEFGKKGDGPLSYPADDCLDPRETIDGTEYFWHGLTQGWADRYGWYLPEQMIDTKGLKDGRYALFTTVDPDNKLKESKEANNCVSVVVDLTGLATSAPRATIAGPGPKCR
jgi:hypothetical protein